MNKIDLTVLKNCTKRDDIKDESEGQAYWVDEVLNIAKLLYPTSGECHEKFDDNDNNKLVCMELNGYNIYPFDCTRYESAQHNKYYMFPLYNKMRCLHYNRVTLDYRMRQCINADEDPMFIEGCLKWIHDNYEVGFASSHNYNILRGKPKKVEHKKPY